MSNSGDKMQTMHANQLEVLNSLHQIHPSKIRNIAVLGQYEGYTAEDKVDSQSVTETYAALRLGVDTPRWKGMRPMRLCGRIQICRLRFF